MEYKKVTITPALAEEWLRCNTLNRKLSSGKVIDYGIEMAEGRWCEDSHQGISFGVDGSIMDGQHRLAAIALSGVTLNLWVATDQPIKQMDIFTRDVIDVGGKRSPGDILSLERGVQNSQDVSAITNNIFRIAHIGQACPGRISVPVQAFIYNIYKHEINMVVNSSRHIKGLKSGITLACFAFAAKDHLADAINFEESFWDGVNLESGSPILAFRNFCLGFGNQSSAASRSIVFKACLYSLYCYIKGRKIIRLGINNAGTDYFLKKQSGNIAKIKTYLGSRNEISQNSRAKLIKKIAEKKPAWCPKN